MNEYFFNDYLLSDYDGLLEELGMNEDDIAALPDDWEEECVEAELQKIFVLKKEFVVNAVVEATEIWEDRFPEQSESTFKEIEKAISEAIDIEKLNSLLPEVYYPTGKKFKVTKSDLLEWIK